MIALLMIIQIMRSVSSSSLKHTDDQTCIIQCDEKTHLYYFHHFIHDFIIRFHYFVTCLISNLILILILYIIFIYMLHLHICSLHYLFSTLFIIYMFVVITIV